MKIAQVCPYDFSRHGGVKTHILQLSNALRRLGHEVHIIAPNGAEKVNEHHVHCFGNNFSMPFLGTKIDVNAALGAERRKLRSFLRNENFDIVHFHTIWNPLLPFQVLRLSKRSKCIATFHDSPKDNFVGKFLGRYMMPLMARLIFTQLSGIISVSQSQSKFISRYSKREINIIPNGIEIAEQNQTISTPRDPNQLLFLGRLEPRKGVMSTLRAFQVLQEHQPDLKLKVAGEGDQLSEAQAFAQNNGLKNVQFLGKVSDDDKWKLLSSSEIYIASAEYGESFGIVLLEAMTKGTLLAGFANEGYKNVLTDGQLKFFIGPADWQNLASRILDLLKLSSEEKSHLRHEGFANAKNFDWENLVGRVIEVYQM